MKRGYNVFKELRREYRHADINSQIDRGEVKAS
jgi:hypothetical protein